MCDKGISPLSHFVCVDRQARAVIRLKDRQARAVIRFKDRQARAAVKCDIIIERDNALPGRGNGCYRLREDEGFKR